MTAVFLPDSPAAVWTKILSLAEAVAPAGSDAGSPTGGPELCIVPTVRGERHSPHQRAAVSGVTVDNTGLGQVTEAICRGIAADLDR